MKILLIGSGGREFSIARKLVSSPRLSTLYIAPGNPGMAAFGKLVPISDASIHDLLAFAKAEKIDLTFVGPETPLSLGIVDLFEKEGLLIVGPNKVAAQLEGSKAWAKEKMKRYGIPTATYETFTTFASALDYVMKRNTYPIVVKADGLAAGKGVTVAQSEEEAESALHDCFNDKKFADAGLKVVIEDFLVGEEASYFAFCDGTTILPMVSAQDHKAVFNDDKGPNTGGMGCYSPSPLVTSELEKKMMDRVLKPLIDGFKKDGIVYKGILYAGLMIHKGEPSIVEFNARFGDPETQVIMPRLKSDLVDVLEAVAKGTLHTHHLEWSEDPAVCVVMTAKGYPNAYQKGDVISGVSDAEILPSVHVVYAGVKADGDELITNGGRVLGVVAQASDLQTAIDNAYKGVARVHFDGAHYRTDVGAKALRLLKQH